jgi:hypothetical protein
MQNIHSGGGGSLPILGASESKQESVGGRNGEDFGTRVGSGSSFAVSEMEVPWALQVLALCF